VKPIEQEESMSRAYIPVCDGWEIQTKGTGSTFRIATTTEDGPRYAVLDERLHGPLEEMARAIHAHITRLEEEVVEHLRDYISAAGHVKEDGLADSQCMSSVASAMRRLAEIGKFRITKEFGRCVEGYFT